MRAAGFLALTAAFALASWLGWWTVPVLGLVWGALHARPAAKPPQVARPLRSAAFAALLGWGVWLLYDLGAGQGGLGRLGWRVAGSLGLPLGGLVAATLLFPALLAWSAAALGGRLVSYLPSRPNRRPPEPGGSRP